MLGNSKCQTLANDLRRLRFHKDITVAGVAQVWVPVLDEAAKAQPHSAQHAQPATCPKCGSGVVPFAPVVLRCINADCQWSGRQQA